MKASPHTRKAKNHAGSRMKKAETAKSVFKKAFGILLLVFGVLVSFIYIYELIAKSAHIILWSREFYGCALCAASAVLAFAAGIAAYRRRGRKNGTAAYILYALALAGAVCMTVVFSAPPSYFAVPAGLSAALIIHGAICERNMN